MFSIMEGGLGVQNLLLFNVLFGKWLHIIIMKDKHCRGSCRIKIWMRGWVGGVLRRYKDLLGVGVWKAVRKG